MGEHLLPDLPIDSELDKLSSDQLSDMSASFTNKKDAYHAEYKAKQDRLHEKIAEKQKMEQDERIKNDPDYWDKHQGVGQIQKPS